MSDDDTTTDALSVVVNDIGYHSIWPADREPPAGWRRVGDAASREECLADIERVWRDIRPVFLRSGAGRPDLSGRAPLIPDLFEQAVTRDPARAAITFAGLTLSYGELNAWANRVAHVLEARGAGPESVVGLLIDRSLELLVGVMATLKVGAAYMPLDPTHPPARLRDQHRQCDVTVVLTRRAFLGTVQASATPGTAILALDDSGPQARPVGTECDTWGARNPDRSQLGPENAINVLFTSGSTGKPKGVVNRYGAIGNRLTWMQRTYPLGPDDVVLQKTPVTFDVSGWEMLWPLIQGVRLVIARPEGHKDPVYLSNLISDEKVTVIHFVPTMLGAFLSEDGVSPRSASLRVIFASGEELPQPLLAACQARFNCAIYNLYGPTEAAIDVTSWKCEPGWTGRVPIGRPIDGCETYVLDNGLDPVQPGQPGELCLGGACLARGYVNSTRLTAEKFVPNPFSGVAGDRLYRTGDLARVIDGGVIEYLGRIDTQLKLHGQRVELTEIESALETHPKVGRAAVCPARSEGSGVRLVAFYSPAGGDGEPDSAGLRKHLAERLPDYMIPHHFVGCEALPHTVSGKLDRSSLAAQAAAHLDARAARVTPGGDDTSARDVLARVWARVLLHERIEDDDNFFECGGDSIQALAVTAEARKAGLDVRPRDLYEHASFGRLARALEQRGAVPGRPATAAQPDWSARPDVGCLPLTPIQCWFFDNAPDGLDHWNQSMLLACRSPMRPAALERAFRTLLQRHDAFALRYERSAGGWAASYGPSSAPGNFETVPSPGPVGHDAVSLRSHCERLQASLDIRRGPLAAMAMFPQAWQGSDVVFLAVHHLAIDGISWRVLVSELADLYRAACEGREADPSARPVAYGHWALQLRRYASGPAVQAERACWEAVCTESATERLPRPGPASARCNVGTHLRIHTVELPADVSAVLTHRLPGFYRAHINEVLMTALAVALTGWTRSEVNRVLVEGHGREAIDVPLDLSGSVGWFTSIFPVNLSAPRSAPLQVVLDRTRERFRSLPARGFSFLTLKYLVPEAGGPVGVITPDVTFNYLGEFDSTFRAESCFRPLELDRGAERDPSAPRFEVLYVEGAVRNGRARFDWHFSSRQLAPDEVARCADSFRGTLEGLVDHYHEVHASRQSACRSRSWAASIDPATATALEADYPHIQSVSPMLPLQQGIYYHMLLSKDTRTYAVLVRLHVHGGLDPDLLLRSWRTVERETDVLRCRPAQGWDRPLLVFLEHSECPVWIADRDGAGAAPGLPVPADRPGEAPLQTIRLVRVARDPAVWCLEWTHSHMLLDGTSARLVLDKLFRYYSRPAESGPRRDEGTRSFSHFAFVETWEHAARSALADRCFWKRELNSLTAVPPLPRVGDRSLDDGFADTGAVTVADHGTFGAIVKGAAADLSADRVRDAARRIGVPPGTVFYAAWSVLLGKLAGSGEVCFLTTHSLRSPEQPQFENTIGMCLNTLPLALRLDDSLSLADYCRLVAGRLTGVRDHGRYPLHDILAGRQDLREELATRLTLLNIESYPDVLQAEYGTLRLAGLEFIEQPTYPLTLNIRWDRANQRYDLELLFLPGYYAAPEAARLLACVEAALRLVVGAPNRSVGSVHIAGPVQV